ncbi:hypothetical protein CTAYLR_004269 [Chrysophaeum taylorii]|uniref:GMP synthase (glutamine-hydrolyzing) n=1 Tax=Chrysophaeum taylorii TaxID=2483200 RepID=A0AAD7XM16_9STRA|nr:hypothetical protein CTAYLR_004269 [Chrysophaeum taylorii]
MIKAVYVVDCGGQYCHLIASRIRQHEALSKVVPCDVAASSLLGDVGAVIVSGGPESVFDPSSRRVDPALWDLEVPILGICYGCQMLCQDLGGRVEAAPVGEFGRARLFVSRENNSLLLTPEHDGSVVWMSHRDRVTALPPDFETIATTEHSPHAAVAHKKKPLFGLQLHPEVAHTERGLEILRNFVDLAGLRGTWRCADVAQHQISRIQEKTGENLSVFVLVSGGVDSAVAFALIAKALPAHRVAGLYVDTGMMRKDETAKVKASLRALGGNLKFVDASDLFLKNLEGVTNPEAKRRVIGDTFLQVQKEECGFLSDDTHWLLGQGTIYPDTIESGKGGADVIKTHHNRVPEIERLLRAGQVVEPLAQLYKDEVRAVGEKLGLPKHLVWRHPFPGPGLGVRLLCVEDERPPPSRVVVLRNHRGVVKVDIPPLRSVGCQGDSRTYKNFVVFKTGYPRDWVELDRMATDVINEHDAINRATISLTNNATPFVITPGAPHTVTRSRLDLLREADALVHQAFVDADLMTSIWQCPVAMAPLTFHDNAAAAASSSSSSKETIILRPVDSTEAMTASFSKLPWDLLDHLTNALFDKLGDRISDVLFDITNKPPGTIEWE